MASQVAGSCRHHRRSWPIDCMRCSVIIGTIELPSSDFDSWLRRAVRRFSVIKRIKKSSHCTTMLIQTRICRGCVKSIKTRHSTSFNRQVKNPRLLPILDRNQRTYQIFSPAISEPDTTVTSPLVLRSWNGSWNRDLIGGTLRALHNGRVAAQVSMDGPKSGLLEYVKHNVSDPI